MVGHETKLLMSQATEQSLAIPICYLACCAIVLLNVHRKNIHMIIFIVRSTSPQHTYLLCRPC